MEEKKIRLLDTQFAKFLAAQSPFEGNEKTRFQEVICNLSMNMGSGDSCLPISEAEEHLLKKSGLVGVEGYPLVVWQNHLYLQRIFAYENNLADRLLELVESTEIFSADDSLLDVLFGVDKEGEKNWQRVAAEHALGHRFLIISGGPGTGKTSTVVKILIVLLTAIRVDLHIALVAPTGKAAMRLQESIGGSVAGLSLSDSLKKAIPCEASTIHRLLGVLRFSPFFRHNRKNPLPYDVVIVDEASMVDLAMMTKLVDALRPGCRFILLGDKNQLASVESGAVLGDLISSLPENTIELQRSYRFDEGIKGFAEAINAGDSERAWAIMESETPGNVSPLLDEVAEYGGEKYRQFMEAVQGALTVTEYTGLFSFLRSFVILCALRNGPAGVFGVNAAIEQYLTGKGYDCFSSSWYKGRPVMVTRNNYALNLFNGDVGICLPDPDNPEVMKVWFEQADGGLRGWLPGRLGSCETVYALTIHKSQGTEIGEVLVVLPEKASDLITRELLYTAVTRAVKVVKVKSNRIVFRAAVGGKIARSSGLAELLRKKKKTTTPT